MPYSRGRATKECLYLDRFPVSHDTNSDRPKTHKISQQFSGIRARARMEHHNCSRRRANQITRTRKLETALCITPLLLRSRGRVTFIINKTCNCFHIASYLQNNTSQGYFFSAKKNSRVLCVFNRDATQPLGNKISWGENIEMMKILEKRKKW